MSAKRQKLPVIEAFILTGLLVDFISQVEPRLEQREPMRVAQTTCITLQSSRVKTLVNQFGRYFHQPLSLIQALPIRRE